MKPKLLGVMLPKSGKPHQTHEVYDIEEACKSLLATNYKNPPRILVKEKRSVHQTSD